MLTIASALLENMRPRQWAKNGFVFAGILFDRQLTDVEALTRVLVAFVFLCLTASTVYLVNDVADVEKDRLHPKKRHRPIASGRLPVPVALSAAAVFTAVSVGGALLFSPLLAVVLVIYVVLHMVYSYSLKNIVVMDVFAIAAGFVLRVLAGVVVIEVQQFSPWLYVCAGLLSLFLAVGKRRQELIELQAAALAGGESPDKLRGVFKDYNLPFLDDMLRLVLASTAVSYTIYTIDANTLLAEPRTMLLTIPFVYYGLFRYLYIIHVKEGGSDPTEVLFIDRTLQITIAAWGLLIFLLLYLQ